MAQQPREKPPRKEDLLPRQETAKLPPKQPDAIVNIELQKAKDQAEIAAHEDKRAEAEIRTKLRQQGYESLESGLKDIDNQRQEASDLLKQAQEIRESTNKEREQAEAEKQRIMKAIEILKQREATINARLEKAMSTEKTFNEKDARYASLKQELKELVAYHETNIKPCVKSLRLVTSTLYNWIDILNTETNYDFSRLYNYICKVTLVLDRYIGGIPPTIPKDILPESEDDTTA